MDLDRLGVGNADEDMWGHALPNDNVGRDALVRIVDDRRGGITNADAGREATDFLVCAKEMRMIRNTGRSSSGRIAANVPEELFLVRPREALVGDRLRPPLVKLDEILSEFAPLRFILNLAVRKAFTGERMGSVHTVWSIDSSDQPLRTYAIFQASTA